MTAIKTSINSPIITDFMGALQVVETITLRLAKERSEQIASKGDCNGRFRQLFDWSTVPDKIIDENPNDEFGTSLFDELNSIITDSYAFLPYTLYLACADKLELDQPFTVNHHYTCYKIKQGESITVRGY